MNMMTHSSATMLLYCALVVAVTVNGDGVSDTFKVFNERAGAIRLALNEARSSADIIPIESEIRALPVITVEQPDWSEWRRLKLEVLMHALKRVHELKDPTFDWKRDAPSMSGPIPPGEKWLPAGTSPEKIEDPALRAQYEKAIEEWKAACRRCDEQVALRRIESRFTMNLRGFILVEYAPKGATDPEVVPILALLPLEQAETVRVEQQTDSQKSSRTRRYRQPR